MSRAVTIRRLASPLVADPPLLLTDHLVEVRALGQP